MIRVSGLRAVIFRIVLGIHQLYPPAFPRGALSIGDGQRQFIHSYFVSMRDYGSYMSALLKYTLVLPATLTTTNGLRARQQTRILNVYLISRSEPI